MIIGGLLGRVYAHVLLCTAQASRLSAIAVTSLASKTSRSSDPFF